MLDIILLREEPQRVRENLKRRGADEGLYDVFLKLDGEWREKIAKVDALRTKQKELTTARNIEEAKENKQRIRTEEKELQNLSERRLLAWRELPNMVEPDVQSGGEEDAEIIRTVGQIRPTEETPRDYLSIATQYDLIDLERGAKVSGARFYYLKNEAALLSMALVRYGMQLATDAGYAPILPPVLVGEEAMQGMGYLEHGGKDETYHFEKDKLYLVGTAEQAIGPLHMNETLQVETLPLRYVAFSSSFRREAGSYGKDTKGILRVHQFDKVEMFTLTTPETANDEHEKLLSLQETFMQGLGLPYRVVRLAAGDIGQPSARTYDIEAWIPSQQRYRETHSCSTTSDYQSRRLNIQYKSVSDTAPLTMLNGTMVAVNRPLIALLETYQNSDGTITIPPVLQAFIGKKKIG